MVVFMDKGDLGTLVGIKAGGATAATAGLGAPLIIGASAVGGYLGHHLAEPHHYKPMYSHK